MSENTGISPALALVRELHEYLLDALIAKFGDELQVDESADPENGLVSYRFIVNGAIGTAAIQPFTENVAVVSFNGNLGRVYRGYGRALRWLGHNRVFNTLSVCLPDPSQKTFDLWVSSNRNTLTRDEKGVRAELADFCMEVRRAITGLRIRFPHFVDAEDLHNFRIIAAGNERWQLAMVAPNACLKAMDDDEEIRQELPLLYFYVTSWLGEWEKNLQILGSDHFRALVANDPEWEAAIPVGRRKALHALGRFQEINDYVLPSLTGAISEERFIVFRAECLCELGREEEALELLQSADLDADPLVHFVRACACTKLGRVDEAEHHLAQYDSMVGPDWYAKRKLAALAKVYGCGEDELQGESRDA